MKIINYAIVIILLLATNSFAELSQKQFIDDLNSIKIGMQRSEVKSIMKDYIVGTNFPWISGLKVITLFTQNNVTIDYVIDEKPDNNKNIVLKDCDVYRWSNNKENDSDWGIIQYKNNLVVSVEFTQD